MGGRHNHHIKTWQFLLIFILLAFVFVTLLRLDHIHMTTLRNEVLRADEANDSELLASSLKDLQSFTSNHIVVNVVEKNGLQLLEFGTGVFYLEQSYLRDAGAILEAAANQEIDDSNPHGNVYVLASNACRPLAIANGWAWNNPNYINCVQNELAKYPADSLDDGTITVALPSTELYRREFSSPIWAPTASGFVLLALILLAVVIFIRLIMWVAIEITLRFL
ncbi:hypothetical protein IJH29_02550 [Candidatus Saccharibacteria bacterium]|nr:hypothetical protein [Candidatus Saccharibacteria bacterium]